MALPTNIETLLDGQVVEWARIEFKETWDAQASLKTICVFANDIDNWGGGYVVLGVKEAGSKRKTVGVPPEKVDSWLKDMLNKCKLIQPPYMPITEVSSYEGKTFVVIWAPGGSQRPYSSPKSMGSKTERVHWIRKVASTIAPSHEEEIDLYNLANNVPFDDRINHEADISDLSLPLIKTYLKEVGSTLYELADTMSFSELCRSMNIVDGPSEYTKPKNVGLLFFSPNPEAFFPFSAHIDVVELPDGEGGDRIYEHTFSGPLDAQLRDALRYLRNYVIEETIEKVPNQAESNRYFNYPYAALEEALANAVYHKGYDSPESILETDEDRLYFLVTIFARPSVSPGSASSNGGSTKIEGRHERILAYLKDNPSESLATAGKVLGISPSTLNRDIARLKAEHRLIREGPKRGGKWLVS